MNRRAPIVRYQLTKSLPPHHYGSSNRGSTSSASAVENKCAAMAEQMKRSNAAARNRARRLKIVVAKSRLGLRAKGK